MEIYFVLLAFMIQRKKSGFGKKMRALKAIWTLKKDMPAIASSVQALTGESDVSYTHGLKSFLS